MLNVKLSGSARAIVIHAESELGAKATISMPLDKHDGMAYVETPASKASVPMPFKDSARYVLDAIFSAQLVNDEGKALVPTDYQELQVKRGELYLSLDDDLYTLERKLHPKELAVGDEFIALDEETTWSQLTRFHLLRVKKIADVKDHEYPSVQAYLARYRILTLHEVWNELYISVYNVGTAMTNSLQHVRLTERFYYNNKPVEFFKVKKHAA